MDHCFEFRPFISIICNITPDHLDRYEYNFQNYIDSKFRVIQAQTSTDKFIVFTDNEPIISELEKRTILPQILEISVMNQPKQGAWLNGGELELNANGIAYSIPVESFSLKGKHNYLNTMAAVLACIELGVEKRNILSGLITFKAVEHRLEEAGIVEGVTFVNDSKATNVDSVFYALDSMETPVVLIMGGVDKGNDYNQIESLVRSKVKALVCMGTDNSKLVGYFYDKLDRIVETNSIEQAVNEAFKLAQSGDTVLLSPACASFDLFKNYEDRGRQFKQIVNSIKSTVNN